MARRSSSFWGWGHWDGSKNDVGIRVDNWYCVINAGNCSIFNHRLREFWTAFQIVSFDVWTCLFICFLTERYFFYFFLRPLNWSQPPLNFEIVLLYCMTNNPPKFGHWRVETQFEVRALKNGKNEDFWKERILGSLFFFIIETLLNIEKLYNGFVGREELWRVLFRYNVNKRL